MTKIEINDHTPVVPGFTVMTYNIHRGQGVLRKRDKLDAIVQALSENPADVICFQEVFSEDETSTPELSQALGAEGTWIHQNITYFVEEGHQGNAILSRFPIKRSRYFDLTVGKNEERGLLLADIEIPCADESRPDQLVHIGCLHLGLIETERQTQLTKLEAILSDAIMDIHPFILAGDFNDWRRKIWMEPFLKTKMNEAFHVKTGHYAKSFPSFFPLLPLDRIYYSRCELLDSQRLSGTPWKHLSDHLPLLAHFKRPRLC